MLFSLSAIVDDFIAFTQILTSVLGICLILITITRFLLRCYCDLAPSQKKRIAASLSITLICLLFSSTTRFLKTPKRYAIDLGRQTSWLAQDSNLLLTAHGALELGHLDSPRHILLFLSAVRSFAIAQEQVVDKLLSDRMAGKINAAVLDHVLTACVNARHFMSNRSILLNRSLVADRQRLAEEAGSIDAFIPLNAGRPELMDRPKNATCTVVSAPSVPVAKGTRVDRLSAHIDDANTLATFLLHVAQEYGCFERYIDYTCEPAEPAAVIIGSIDDQTEQVADSELGPESVRQRDQICRFVELRDVLDGIVRVEYSIRPSDEFEHLRQLLAKHSN